VPLAAPTEFGLGICGGGAGCPGFTFSTGKISPSRVASSVALAWWIGSIHSCSPPRSTSIAEVMRSMRRMFVPVSVMMSVLVGA
jgi:hypothetical protein